MYFNIARSVVCKKGDEASPSIILDGQTLLVKMLIPFTPRGAYGSNFVYLFILTLSIHWYVKRGRGFTEHHFGRSSSFNENAHNSWTAWYIMFKFCLLMYFNIAQPLVFFNIKHQYLRNLKAEFNQILSEASFGWEKGCTRFWTSRIELWFTWQQIAPIWR